MNDQQRAAMIRPRGKSEAPHMIAAYRAMQMAYQALRNCCGTLTYVDDKHRVVREPTVAGAVRALAAIEEALAQPQGEHPPSRHCECVKCVEYFGDSVCESSFHPETWKPQDHIRDATKKVQGEWVDLTDAEIALAVGSPLDEVYLSDFRAVIAKFKEKNTQPVVPQGEPVGFVRIDKNGECDLHGYTLWRLGSGDYDIYLAPPSVEAAKEKQNV